MRKLLDRIDTKTAPKNMLDHVRHLLATDWYNPATTGIQSVYRITKGKKVEGYTVCMDSGEQLSFYANGER